MKEESQPGLSSRKSIFTQHLRNIGIIDQTLQHDIRKWLGRGALDFVPPYCSRYFLLNIVYEIC